jgi:hypothetical protein
MKLSGNDLRKLPLLAVVTFTARCARRVRPLCRSTDSAYQEALDQAILIAESCAKGEYVDRSSLITDASDAARAIPDDYDEAACAAYCAASAASAAYIYPEHDEIDPYDSAVNAAGVTDDADAAAAAASDYRLLLSLELGRPYKIGRSVDPGEWGPLGPIWPQDKPAWFRNPYEPDASSITIYLDTAEFDDEEIAGILGHLSDLYRSVGGDALIIDRTETLDPALVLGPLEV